LFACDDLAKNEADLKRIRELLSMLQAGSTPVSLLLPWFPSPARKSVKKGTTELFTLLHNYVEARRHAEPTNNTIDTLIAEGENTQNIVGFIMGALFAGTISTGIIPCWVLVDLAVHPEWREKCKNEIREFISRHSDFVSAETLRDKLGAIPASAWEDGLPILDACIRETQRITFSSVLLRRTLGEIKIGRRVIKRGDFLAYLLDDIHFDPEYYPEPRKYDPGRWLQPGRIPTAATYSFVGWGAGRHPCTGMKVAKLEMKLISAMFLTRYEYDLVDEDGKFPDPLPVPDKNRIHQTCRGGPYYFDIQKVME